MTLEKSETEVYCGLENACKQMQTFQWEEAEKFVKHTAKFIAFLAILFIFFSTNALLLGQSIKLIDEIKFLSGLEETQLPLDTKSFCVSEDQLFIIPDYRSGNIKIYEKNGENLELISTIGRKGYGPGEFVKPAFCSYSKDESKFVVMDLGIRKIFIYDRISRISFKLVKEVPCWRGGTDIKSIRNKLFIAGYTSDQVGNPYDFYYIDLTNDKTVFLLPSYRKYGLQSFKEYEIQNRSKSVIPVIGIRGFFDINRDEVYFVWEGNLKIIKLNIVSGGIDTNTFGIQPPHYIKPYASENLLEARKKEDFNVIQKELAKMSYVRNIFVNSKDILVIYEGPVKQSSATNFRMQFYTLDGNFIKEVLVPGQFDNKMWFDKDMHILYSLSRRSDTFGEHYFILKYEIHE